MSLIEVHGLTKSFDGRTVVSDLSLLGPFDYWAIVAEDFPAP